MDWACGVALGIEATAMTASSEGGVITHELDLLRTHGLPHVAKRTRRVYQTDLSMWERDTSDQYLGHFGITLPRTVRSAHQIFRFYDGSRKVIVPALALMRAMLRPSQHVFGIAFLPGNIDLLSYVDFSGPEPEVVVTDLGLHRYMFDRPFRARPSEMLRWLQLSYSARRSAHSVHRNALDGRIDLDLPIGNTKLVLHGMTSGGVTYVNQVELLSTAICASDSVSGRPEEFFFHASADPDSAQKTRVLEITVPARSNGCPRVSDSEWAVVGPILVAASRAKAFKHNPRAVLDAILVKITSRTPWLKALPTGSPLTVHTIKASFRQWTIDGRLERTLSHLRACRSQT